MKISTLIIGLSCLLLASEGFSQQTQTPPPSPQMQTPSTSSQVQTPAPSSQVQTPSTPSIDSQKRLQTAKEGCQKSLGWFPTPSKLMCILYVTGQNEKDVKAKAVALIFSVCHGRVSKADTKDITPKNYETLGQCFNDPNALTLINRELQAYNYPPIDLKLVKKNMEDLKIFPASVTQ